VGLFPQGYFAPRILPFLFPLFFMANNYQQLAHARADMRKQSEFYQPTVFWDEASSRIADELIAHGFERFRALPSALSFFVPTYGTPGSSYTREQVEGLRHWFSETHPQASKPAIGLERFITGESSAHADYRVLLAADDVSLLPRLHTFTESAVGGPVEHFEFDGRKFSRSSLNYLLGLALLKKHIGNNSLRTVMEIGAGFGVLGEILASSAIEGSRYIDIDIPPTSCVAEYYLSEVLGAENVATYSQTCDRAEIEIASLPQASVLCSWQIEQLRGEVDLFVNFISFQEMEPHIVANYLSHVTRLKASWILLRNLREGKQKRA
jgi:putative sugar O-methyltransferase